MRPSPRENRGHRKVSRSVSLIWNNEEKAIKEGSTINILPLYIIKYYRIVLLQFIQEWS